MVEVEVMEKRCRKEYVREVRGVRRTLLLKMEEQGQEPRSVGSL